jgi:hypothetical protein
MPLVERYDTRNRPLAGKSLSKWRRKYDPAVTEWAENWRRQQGRGDAPLTAADAQPIGMALLTACNFLKS